MLFTHLAELSLKFCNFQLEFIENFLANCMFAMVHSKACPVYLNMIIFTHMISTNVYYFTSYTLAAYNNLWCYNCAVEAFRWSFSHRKNVSYSNRRSIFAGTSFANWRHIGIRKHSMHPQHRKPEHHNPNIHLQVLAQSQLSTRSPSVSDVPCHDFLF